MKVSNLDFNKFTNNYISEKSFQEEMRTKVEPYLDSLRKGGYLTGSNGLKFYYETFIKKNSKASIVICHGFGEFIERYHELIYYFLRENYLCFLPFSERAPVDFELKKAPAPLESFPNGTGASLPLRYHPNCLCPALS